MRPYETGKKAGPAPAGCIMRRLASALFLSLVILSLACVEAEKPDSGTFLTNTLPPADQEFRWSNGGLPKSFDPVRAGAPPESDIVRAIYDGLTETDPGTLEALPAIAVRWTSEDGHTTWTFELRRDAKWSNGEPVTADDFVRSWRRLAAMGDEAAHHELFANIIGFGEPSPQMSTNENNAGAEALDSDPAVQTPDEAENVSPSEGSASRSRPAGYVGTGSAGHKGGPSPGSFGVRALDERTLRVRLRMPDREFPKLAAHPMLRPVHAGGRYFNTKKLGSDIITNGAFRVAFVGAKGVELRKAENYYARDSVKLQRVRFVPAKDADSALKAYREGRVDAVTNADFEPLALKLLTPFSDFRRATHSAVNLYEFNRRKAPFNDRRVREAMAIAIEREQLTNDIMHGATKPAYGFLPFRGKDEKPGFTEDVARARELMRKAGFTEGKGFPLVRLVINRNNVQQEIARSVAKMWEKNLNIETEVVVREFEEVEIDRKEGDFDLIRRGVVLPTADETANMLAIFHPDPSFEFGQTGSARHDGARTGNRPDDRSAAAEEAVSPENGDVITRKTPGLTEFDGLPPGVSDELMVDIGDPKKIILTEEAAFVEVPAIPLYFPTSYSLVRPYVLGFEINSLDTHLLKAVRINEDWQPKGRRGES